MKLLEKARRQRDAQAIKHAQEIEQRYRSYRLDLLPGIRRILDLEPDEISFEDLTVTDPRRRGSERALYEFDYEDLHFIAGRYWHGNPGDSFLLAVKVGKTRGKPEWPPPSPQSARNTRWSPEGYKTFYSLAQLADAVEAGDA